MSNTFKGHILKYKKESGEWVDIPIAIVDVYDRYVAYCAENNIEPVSETDYCKALSDIDTKLANIESVLGTLDNIEALQGLITALQGGILPTTKGGTGVNYASSDAFVTDMYDKAVNVSKRNHADDRKLTTLDVVKTTIQSAIDLFAKDNMDSKFDAAEILWGTEAPDSHTPGTYYFQVKE